MRNNRGVGDPVRSSTRFGGGPRHRRRALRHHHLATSTSTRRSTTCSRLGSRSRCCSCLARAGICCEPGDGRSRFPTTPGPPFARLFRVRLAADAISFFTDPRHHRRAAQGDAALRPRAARRHRGGDHAGADSPSRSCRSSSPASSHTSRSGGWRCPAAGTRSSRCSRWRRDRCSPSCVDRPARRTATISAGS